MEIKISQQKFFNECRDDQVVMFVDANNVIFYDNPENIKKKFLEFNKNIVVSTEKYCAPNEELIKYYPEETKNVTFRCKLRWLYGIC